MSTKTTKLRLKPKTFNGLRVGDIVRSRLNGMAYVIVSMRHDEAVAVRHVGVSNMSEWDVLDPITCNVLKEEP